MTPRAAARARKVPASSWLIRREYPATFAAEDCGQPPLDPLFLLKLYLFLPPFRSGIVRGTGLGSRPARLRQGFHNLARCRQGTQRPGLILAHQARVIQPRPQRRSLQGAVRPFVPFGAAPLPPCRRADFPPFRVSRSRPSCGSALASRRESFGAGWLATRAIGGRHRPAGGRAWDAKLRNRGVLPSLRCLVWSAFAPRTSGRGGAHEATGIRCVWGGSLYPEHWCTCTAA